MPEVFTYSSARVAILARTPARSVMSISYACLCTSRAWIAVLAAETGVDRRFALGDSSVAGSTAASARTSGRVPSMTVSGASGEGTSLESGRLRASSLSLSANRVHLHDLWPKPPERVGGGLAYARVGVDLEVPQVLGRGARVQRTERLRGREPDLPVAVLQGLGYQRGGARRANPSQRADGDHSFAPASVLHELDQRGHRGSPPPKACRQSQRRPYRLRLPLA